MTQRHAKLRQQLLAVLVGCTLLCTVSTALAWGSEGHRVVALIAQNYLDPQAKTAVDRILASDTDPLTGHDIADEATWADAWRDAGRDLDAGHHHRTSQWHFINLELSHPDFSYACWKQRPLPAGTLASQGPWHDCVVDKINQFEAELASPRTNPHERLLALKFLLHLIGDLHQPLHAADDHDHGGNDEKVSGLGHYRQRLHHAWDSTFVRDIGPDPQTVAAILIRDITPQDQHRWAQGTPTDWAWESWRIAKKDVYGRLPSSNHHHTEHLDASYIRNANKVVAQQLSKAGVRLAWLLNRALAPKIQKR